MKRILFIGNSFTYFHDLPAMVETLSHGVGYETECRSVVKGGWYLRRYADPADEMNIPLREAYAQGSWDVIVLQDQSLNPAKDPEAFLQAVDKLCRELACGQFAFYQTWAYEDGSAKLEAAGMDYETMHLGLKRAYREAARRHGAICVPVGDGFAACHEKYPELELYEADHFHPSLAGTYLAACIFYAVLSGCTPLTLQAAEGLDGDKAKKLCEIAHQVCMAQNV